MFTVTFYGADIALAWTIFGLYSGKGYRASAPPCSARRLARRFLFPHLCREIDHVRCGVAEKRSSRGVSSQFLFYINKLKPFLLFKFARQSGFFLIHKPTPKDPGTEFGIVL
ncbi:MAG: hypothetical protein AAFQ59_09710 [Pseudomonadota bacterium]